MTCEQLTLEILKLLVPIIGFIGTWYFAGKGLNQWKYQLKVKSLDKTENALVMIAEFVDAVLDITSPYSGAEERPNESEGQRRRRGRENRLKLHERVLSTMDSTFYEAQLYLPQDVLNDVIAVNDDWLEIRVAFSIHTFHMDANNQISNKISDENYVVAYQIKNKEKWVNLRNLCKKKMRVIYNQNYA